MNENLRQIIAETDAWCGYMGFSEYDYEAKWEEKFAELIIRQCADICLEDNDYKNILRYFGVKE